MSVYSSLLTILNIGLAAQQSISICVIFESKVSEQAQLPPILLLQYILT